MIDSDDRAAQTQTGNKSVIYHKPYRCQYGVCLDRRHLGLTIAKSSHPEPLVNLTSLRYKQRQGASRLALSDRKRTCRIVRHSNPRS